MKKSGHPSPAQAKSAAAAELKARADALTLKLRLLAALSVCVAAGMLLVLGAQPIAVGLFPPPWDKLAHTLTFACIGAATGVASGSRGLKLVAWCLAGAVLVGTMDELHQIYLPGRSAGWDDLVADAMGGLLGSVLAQAANVVLYRRFVKL